MDVISYDKDEVDSKLASQISVSFDKIRFLRGKFDFVKNPTLDRQIIKLSDQYKKYKETYKFPTKFKGTKSSYVISVSYI